MTRSFGRVRLHGNGGYTAASQADGGDYWRVGLGSDYPLGLFSRALLADVYVEIPTSQARSRVWVEGGIPSSAPTPRYSGYRGSAGRFPRPVPR